jgi:3-deoxy-D-manno-octulosonate 8-phosphate phosphatase (KDO 8-P phosphatase)
VQISKADITLCDYDFDGVMTDNRILVFQDGTEAVLVNRADGLGVNRIRSLCLAQLILSTETNPVVRARGAKLRIEVIDACDIKEQALRNYCQKNGFDLQRVVYVGNDLNDLGVMQNAGIPVSPADGHPRVRKIAKLVTVAKGGEGVIKELSELISLA